MKKQHQLNNEIEALLKRKDGENEAFTSEDINLLQQYTGSGGLINQGAKGAGVLYEYYTPNTIVQKMWGLARKHGYIDGPVIEPSCGIGRFLRYADPNEETDGMEINPTSARIAQICFPKATISNRPFEALFFEGNSPKKELPAPYYKLAIGNPPYGEFTGRWAGMGEKKATGAQEYDQYFVLRCLQLLLPGGLLVFIVPSAFINNQKNKVKEQIAGIAELVDAYRLPNGVFDTTEIGTDIIVFKRK